jgi:hypothetical protein
MKKIINFILEKINSIKMIKQKNAMKELELLQHKYLENCKTESKNPYVIAVYKVVLDHENSDSDYWSEEYGSSDIIGIFENLFDLNDWNELKMDLINWTAHQLELFTQAILNGYLSYTSYSITGNYYPQDKEIVNEITKSIPYRFDLIFTIIEIENNRKFPTGYSAISEIYDNLDFFNVHFDIILEKDPNNINRIIDLLKFLNIDESYSEIAKYIWDKIHIYKPEND